MSASSETLRLIELTSARLRQDIDADTMAGRGEPEHPGTRQSALLRAAWAPEGTPLSLAGLAELVKGVPDGVDVDLSGLKPASTFPPPVGRTILNLLLLAAESLPSGGDVMLVGSVEDLFMRIQGAGAAWPAGMGACLVDETAAHVAMTAGGSLQMPLTALLAHAAGIRLSFLLSPGAESGPSILRMGGG